MEQEVANLDILEVDAGWGGKCLSDFDAIWDVLTPENRLRLVRAVVQRVEVNEPANEVKVFITDLADAAPPPPAEPAFEAAVRGTWRSPRWMRPSARRSWWVSCSGSEGEEKQFVAELEPEPANRRARVALQPALAHRNQRAIEAGEVRDQAEAARRLRLTRARVSQLLDLTLPAPHIQARVLALDTADGAEPISERALRPVSRVFSWPAQRALFEPASA